jgi:TPP-dependent pyruvate/acetoin dehydrogenase alpha subunit
LTACLAGIWKAVHAARAGEGPQMVVGKLLRLCGHGEHDDGSYVAAQLRESNLGRDCLDVGIAQLIEEGLVSAEEIASWKTEAAEHVQEAVATAQKEPTPDPYQEDWRAVSEEGMQQ